MRLIELHILQSFPVSCLNRDDLNAPKTAVFGGVTRARISSQCLKRAIRCRAKEIDPMLFNGKRSRLIVDPIADAAVEKGSPPDKARQASIKVCGKIATFDQKAFTAKQVRKVKTVMFLSPLEMKEIGAEIARLIAESKDEKALDKKLDSVARKAAEAKLKDAADIAIFGRMVASDHSLTIEGAGMFSHALSTHRAENDIDFYTAVDDLQREDETIEEGDRAGSGMMGTLEFNAAVYYRYIALNLDLLADNDHLGALDRDDRKRAVSAFFQACVQAVPSARKNSMNAATLPGYVLMIARQQGHPLQFVNAFERPVQAERRGWMEPSIKVLKEHRDALEKTWGVEADYAGSVPDVPFAQALEKVIGYVQ